MFSKRLIKPFFLISLVFFFLPLFAAADTAGQAVDFFVDSSFDRELREQIAATLLRVTTKLYFYVDNSWWNGLSIEERTKVGRALEDLADEFEHQIYPVLTSHFGSEWKPGIDRNENITVLLHPMKEEVAGYFNDGDEYFRTQSPFSNEREMVYLNTDYILNPQIKSFLAHEFTHLITFYQKDKEHGITEEIWLNEARAEYASTLVGYDKVYEGSNLQKRARIFLDEPSDSITEWLGLSTDYGALNLFTQYLVDHYGVKILEDSLKSSMVGIPSLDEALVQNGFKQDFSQIFTDWTVAIVANDCEISEKHCYKSENLKNLRVSPSIIFLPLSGKSTLDVTQTTKNWSGNWFKFIGGKGALKIEFIGNPENLFQIPYLSQDLSGNYSLDFFSLDEHQRGEVLVPDFGTTTKSVIIIPSIQSKELGFSGAEPSLSYSWSASTKTTEEEEEDENNNPSVPEKPISEMTKEEIIAKIAEVKAMIAELRRQLEGLTGPEEISCQSFENNLYFGMRDNDEVRCLQEFLKSQGTDVYPEGLVTGYFGSLTQAAVIRFQEKHAEDVLVPWDLDRGTGFVGEKTRIKINELIR